MSPLLTAHPTRAQRLRPELLHGDVSSESGSSPVRQAWAPAPSNRLLFTYVALASLLLHVLLLPAWVLWLGDQSGGEATPVKAACAHLKEQQFAAVQRTCRDPVRCETDDELVVVMREEEPPEPPEQERVELELEPVVTPDDVEETEAPDEASVAADRNSSVEEQSIARGDHYGTTSGAAVSAEQARAIAQARRSARQAREQPEPPTPPSEQPDADDEAKQAHRAPDFEVPEVQDDEGEELEHEAQETALTPREADEPQQLQLPDFDAERVAAVASQDGGTLDYLKDVDEGDKTLLNRKRVSYADFFERVKLGVASNWSPARVYRQRDPSGQVYGAQDRLTVLSVTLHGDGTLAKLYVTQPSGLDFLDDEAMRAMNAAVPFPNPPEGLKDLDGNVHFKFAFYFEISTRRFRLFRYR